LKIGNTMKDINLDKEMAKTQVSVNEQRFNVEVTVSGNAKRIKISNINADRESLKQALFLQNLLKRYML